MESLQLRVLENARRNNTRELRSQKVRKIGSLRAVINFWHVMTASNHKDFEGSFSSFVTACRIQEVPSVQETPYACTYSAICNNTKT